MPSRDIGKRLEMAIRDAGLQPSELCRKIGIKPQRLSTYTTGQVAPPAPMVRELCEALNISADWLLGINKEGYDDGELYQ